jgi:hypothetical protein
MPLLTANPYFSSIHAAAAVPGSARGALNAPKFEVTSLITKYKHGTSTPSSGVSGETPDLRPI